jgi:hypothetical protein
LPEPVDPIGERKSSVAEIRHRELANIKDCDTALPFAIRCAVLKLARLIDAAEKREMFNDLVSGTASRLQAVVERTLRLRDAPGAASRSVAAAGDRGEGESVQLMRPVEGAVWGYLR